MHPVTVAPEVLHVRIGQYVSLGEDDRIALAPLQELADRAQHVVLLEGFANRRTLGRDDERHGVHAKAGHAQLDPEAHDLEDLRQHVRICGVEVRLELVEAMEVPGMSAGVVGPGGLLHARKYHPFPGIRRTLL